ncbi:peptidylprolyl isomerase [Thermodesulfobacteriota bacterium]
MKTIKTFELISIAVLILIALPSVLLAETSNRIVAVVNNNIITLYELNNKIEEVTGLRPDDIKSGDKSAYLETQKNVLNILIDEKITQEKIQELKIQVSSDQVNAAIEDIIKHNRLTSESLIASLESNGISYEHYKDMIKNDIERNKLINYEVKSKIIIREEKVLQYYQEHKEDYTEEAQVSLAGIFLNKNESENLSEKVDLIVSSLEKGEEFKDLAIKHSEGPGADDGGNLGNFKIAQLDPKLKDVLQNMNVGEISAPVKNETGIQIIKLLKKEDTRIIPFEEAKDGIFNILYKEEVNKRYTSWIEDLRKNTYTKINL